MKRFSTSTSSGFPVAGSVKTSSISSGLTAFTELISRFAVHSPSAVIRNSRGFSDSTIERPIGLISMPSPKASGTGYMFLKSLVNSRGEDEAFEYFDKLSENILQFTSSGSGPLNAILQGEVAIGLGMTAPTVSQINEGQPIKIVYFEEGSPFSLYGQSIIKGNEDNATVQAVFEFLVNTFNDENCKNYFPEKLYKDKDYSVTNYPSNIQYSDMSKNTSEEKSRLLGKWKY